MARFPCGKPFPIVPEKKSFFGLLLLDGTNDELSRFVE
jgi:hypothetical protein